MTTTSPDQQTDELNARLSGDVEFLGLLAGDEPGRYDFTVEKHLGRLDGKLYGGTALAASIAAAESLSQRPAQWMTTQFVATAPAGAQISVFAEVLAPGRRTNQMRVTGTDSDGDVMFASLGATGIPRIDGLYGEFENSPKVTPPDECDHWSNPFAGLARFAKTELRVPELPKNSGFSAVMELRHPEILEHPDPGPGRVCLWMRRNDGAPITPTVAAFMADMVPLSVAHGCEVIAGGTSLDNTIRIGRFVESEWILLDLRAHMAAGNYGHGAAHIWSIDGRLMATASQTASMMRFDLPPAIRS